VVDDVVSGFDLFIHEDDRGAVHAFNDNRWAWHMAYPAIRIDEHTAAHGSCTSEIKAEAWKGWELRMAENWAMNVGGTEGGVFEIAGA